MNKGRKREFCELKKKSGVFCFRGKMVGDAGFEPATPWTQTKCATKLR